MKDAGIYPMQERSHNISHFRWENPSHKSIWLKFRPSFTQFFRNLMISICEKVRLQQLKKAKYSILALILHIFEKKMSYRASYLIVQYTV